MGRLEAMQKKSFFETNQHLKDPAKYRSALLANVASSTAIETNEGIETVVKKLTATLESISPAKRLTQKRYSR